MIEPSFRYIEQHRERFLDELKQFLMFPSISRQSRHRQDVANCAAWLRVHLENMGLNAWIVETEGNPIVSAKTRGKSAKKLIIYGHYDVQPEDPLNEWLSPPFQPEVRDGYLYARGATDDKGQLFAHIKGLESLLKTQGSLPCEVQFLIEGEEESGGHALEDYVKAHKAELDAEAIVVSDMAMVDENIPAITYGLRGLVGLELTLRGPCRDVHSGSYGGAVPNPASVLANILARCVGPDGQVLIPGFYDDVRPLEPWERENIKKIHFDDARLMRELELKGLYDSGDAATLERIWARPTFEVNGIYGGYMGEGGKTIIPASAGAKITMRLVPGQDAVKIAKLAVDYLRSVCPAWVSLEISEQSGANPVLVDVSDKIVGTAAKALEACFGAPPIFIREGGSIPVVETFCRELGRPVVLMGFGLAGDMPHSPNERFKIDNFMRGAKTSAWLIGHI